MIAIGRRVYGLGAILLGAVELWFGGFSEDWLPVPPHLASYHILAEAAGALLIAAGVAINLPRVAAVAALALAALFAGTMLALELAPALAKPAVWGGWQAVAESTAMALGGVLAFTQTRAVGGKRAAAIARIARLVFGVCLLIFGVSHFVYAKYTASLVPAWLPPSRMFWTWLTGAAQIAAGLAILSAIRARLAAVMLTAMYVVFGLLVQLPSVIAHPSSHDNWAENGINLLLIGAAWCLADSLARGKKWG
ncbi:MAG: DoxX family membrane protein [Caulobacteraceae bacterium]